MVFWQKSNIVKISENFHKYDMVEFTFREVFICMANAFKIRLHLYMSRNIL